MSRLVLLHVGTPKTGTSYVQDVLWRNRPSLATRGVLYPADRFDAQFLAALDLMRLPWGGLETEAVGAWDRLTSAVRRWPGTSIISHEILATATRAQAERALADLGHPDTEVHLVLSARDLVRQIPAEWQENIKHRRTFRYAPFLAAIADPRRGSKVASWFWSVQELPDILDRWGSSLPPERVHLVTVPKPGAPRDLLWGRFAAVLGLTEVELDLDVHRENPSLGAPETALLRRVNQAVNAVLPPADYRPLVRELLAHRTLSQRERTARLGVPPETWAWADDLSRSWVEEIEKRGYDVVGDLDDLVPDPPTGRYADPDHPRERMVSAAAVDAIRALLMEVVTVQDREEALRRELDDTRDALHRAHLRPTYRMREKVVRRLETDRWGRQVMEGYRRARGRSSRSA